MKDRYIIYVDTGGTFTDSVIVSGDGSFVTGKAPTTPDKLDDCFFNSIEASAKEMGKSLREVLSEVEEIGYGTTVGTNIIVTGAKGPKLGFITTKGIENRTWIWRLRAAGISRTEGMHMIASGYPKPIIPRPLIKGVTERIDCMGDVVIPLREKEVREKVRELLKEGVEGIVVGLLWSFLNNKHELRIREIINEMAPDIMVSLSSEVAPTIREYPRFMSTIIDLHIGKSLRELLFRIEDRLKSYGCKKPLLVMQAVGGVAQAKIVKPGTTLHSGPVGGLVGVEFLKKIYGFKNAMGSDVGGTSFDVTISPERGEEFLREPVVGRYEIATPMREIITIGAGGGTLAWVDNITKTLRVGPESAGAVPGPVCYDVGGTDPTVTDADVVMNRIDPDFFLGGKRKLNREKALKAIKEKIADPLNMDVMKAAEGICKIIDGAMQATLKTTLATKGIDPKDYVLFSFGGAGAVHCAGYSNDLGFKKVIITPYASVFSAFGASTADVKHRYEMSPFIFIPNIPYDVTTLRFELDKLRSLNNIPSWAPERFNKMFEELENRAYSEMKEEGFEKERVNLRYEFLARYGGQLWEIRCQSPVRRINSINDVKRILAEFEEEYLRIYTREAMVPKGGIEIISIALVATAPTYKPNIIKRNYIGEDPSIAIKGKRNVYFDGEWVNTNIYDMDRLQVGNVVYGPAIIEAKDTTVVIPKDRKATKDEYLNLVMEER
jgi:N-methylhydantoinase A/oxoprolinase/acetone carboxylase beta subunit